MKLKTTDNTAQIWAIGGGKGGTGKTFLVSQLGLYLASCNKKVVIIDTDFGGANLHSFFGIKRIRRSIVDFFEKKEPLENFKREILILSTTKKLLTYYETQALFTYRVLEEEDTWFNDNILGKFFRKDFDT